MNKQSEYYEKIGQEIIAEHFPELSDCNIAWIESDKEKKSKYALTYADCTLVTERYMWACGEYDFFITIYEPNVEQLTEEQIKILIRHELMHIGFDGLDTWLIPHDVNEFRKIIDAHGIDWALTDFEARLP